MSAYEELSSTGTAGPETVTLLQRLVRQVTRVSSFPPPDTFLTWSPDAVDTVIGDIFDKRGSALVLGCLAKATDDQSLERLLLKAIRNHLIDEAKGTERGKLRRRLETLLGHDDRFVRVTGPMWVLATQPAGVTWQGDLAELNEAAAAVRGVVLGKLPTSGPTPRGSVEALVTVAHAVLDAAQGAVRDEDLARVIEARFDLQATPVFVELVADERFAPAAPADQEPETIVVEADERAQALWASMSPREHSIFLHLDDLEAVMAVAEVGPETARALIDQLTEKFLRATETEAHLESVMSALRHLCRRRA